MTYCLLHHQISSRPTHHGLVCVFREYASKGDGWRNVGKVDEDDGRQRL